MVRGQRDRGLRRAARNLTRRRKALVLAASVAASATANPREQPVGPPWRKPYAFYTFGDRPPGLVGQARWPTAGMALRWISFGSCASF